MGNLVTKAAYLTRTGMTDGQFRGKVQRSQFIRNKHYFVVDRVTWVDLEAIDQWIRSGGLGPKTTVSKSATVIRPKGTRTSLTSPGIRPIAWKPVV
jgi:hypothetical protein